MPDFSNLTPDQTLPQILDQIRPQTWFGAASFSPEESSFSSILLSASSVPEDAAINTVVGTLSVINATGTPTFTLVDSAGGKFNINGTSLRVNAALDYETATSHAIIISATGMTPSPANGNFTINVGDVVEGGGGLLLNDRFIAQIYDRAASPISTRV